MTSLTRFAGCSLKRPCAGPIAGRSLWGLDAYQQAGGGVLRDLFEHDDGGWLQDVVLLDRLVTEKLKAEAETIAAEGWKWISVGVEFSYGHTQGLREIEGKPVDLSPEEQATIDALNAEQAKLETDYQDVDELPDEIDQRLGEIEAALSAFENRPMHYDPTEIARAGVFISIDSEGRLSVDRGYVRPEDEVSAKDCDVGHDAGALSTEGQEEGASVQRTVIAVMQHRWGRRTKQVRCRNSSPTMRIGRTPATTRSSMRLSDTERDGSGHNAVAWGPVCNAGPHFYGGGLRGRAGPGRV